MPIRPFLSGQAFDPELVTAMGVALERACVRLNLSSNASDGVTHLVANKIIQLAMTGVRDPDTLCRRVLQEFDNNN